MSMAVMAGPLVHRFIIRFSDKSNGDFNFFFLFFALAKCSGVLWKCKFIKHSTESFFECNNLSE